MVAHVLLLKKNNMSKLSDYDNKLRTKYGEYLCGVDECGRGSWASSLFASAVILPPQIELLKVNDSKKLTETQRESLYEEIIKVALAYSVKMVDAETIDEKGLTFANRKAMVDAAKEASNLLNTKVSLYIVDQAPSFPLNPHIMMPKADGISQSVAAASIIGKVTRDRFMYELSKQYPEYGFDENKGYINDFHKQAVLKHGMIKGVHRYSYQVHGVNAPVQSNIFDFGE